MTAHPFPGRTEPALRTAVKWAVENVITAARLIPEPDALHFTGGVLQDERPTAPLRLNIGFQNGDLALNWFEEGAAQGQTIIYLPRDLHSRAETHTAPAPEFAAPRSAHPCRNAHRAEECHRCGVTFRPTAHGQLRCGKCTATRQAAETFVNGLTVKGSPQ